MARLVLVSGDKGGVGKSFYSRLLLNWYQRAGVPVRAYDTDKSNPTLERYFSDSDSIGLLDVESPESLDELLESLANAPKEEVFLLDCAARTFDSIHKWMIDVDFEALTGERGIELTIAFVLGADKDSLRILKTIFEEIGAAAKFVVIMNYGRASSFALYEDSQTRQKLKAAGAVEVVLPALLEKSTLQLDRLNLPFVEAIDHEKVQLADRARVKRYVNEAFTQLDGQKDLWM